MSNEPITLESFLDGIIAAKKERFMSAINLPSYRELLNRGKVYAAAKIIKRNRAKRRKELTG